MPCFKIGFWHSALTTSDDNLFQAPTTLLRKTLACTFDPERECYSFALLLRLLPSVASLNKYSWSGP